MSTATETDETTATATDVEGPTFDFTVEAAPEGYEPERKNPGRTRTPSPFDQTLRDVFGKGWQRAQYTSEDHKNAIYRELTKAKSHTGVGLDLNETDTHVEFRSRELQQRKTRKGKNGEEVLFETDEDGDNDE